MQRINGNQMWNQTQKRGKVTKELKLELNETVQMKWKEIRKYRLKKNKQTKQRKECFLKKILPFFKHRHEFPVAWLYLHRAGLNFIIICFKM